MSSNDPEIQQTLYPQVFQLLIRVLKLLSYSQYKSCPFMVTTCKIGHEDVEDMPPLKMRVRVEATIVGVAGSNSGEVSLDVGLIQSDVLESMFLVDAGTEEAGKSLRGFHLTRKIKKTGACSSEKIEAGWVYFSYNPHLGATHLCPAVLMQVASADGGCVLCYILRADDSIEERILPASHFD